MNEPKTCEDRNYLCCEIMPRVIHAYTYGYPQSEASDGADGLRTYRLAPFDDNMESDCIYLTEDAPALRFFCKDLAFLDGLHVGDARLLIFSYGAGVLAEVDYS